jgi:5-methyltetrahydropteroyltriglutamate--homocysteine methyltransferase
MHFWRGNGYAEQGIYNSPRDFFRDLAEIYRAEIADLAAAGCRYIQLDEVALAMLCDPAVRAQVVADGNIPARLVELMWRQSARRWPPRRLKWQSACICAAET